MQGSIISDVELNISCGCFYRMSRLRTSFFRGRIVAVVVINVTSPQGMRLELRVSEGGCICNQAPFPKPAK